MTTKIRRTTLPAAIVLASITLLLVGLGVSRGEPRTGRVHDGFIVPASRIISFGDTIGRLDTQTGAVYELRGNLDNPSTPVRWKRRVAPLDRATSGVLEIQRATFNDPGATFLVDVVTGETWLLTQRASGNASWQHVKSYR
jgi:hypothetical protein